jgi:hypothetical protein
MFIELQPAYPRFGFALSRASGKGNDVTAFMYQKRYHAFANQTPSA